MITIRNEKDNFKPFSSYDYTLTPKEYYELLDYLKGVKNAQ